MANNLTVTTTQADLNSSASVFFNNYYQPTFVISQNVHDAVLGYFEMIADSKESARVMASAVIYTAQAQRVDPMQFIDRFRSMSVDEIANFTSMFLNLNRVGTSYLGIHNRPQTSKYVQRMIRP